MKASPGAAGTAYGAAPVLGKDLGLPLTTPHAKEPGTPAAVPSGSAARQRTPSTTTCQKRVSGG